MISGKKFPANRIDANNFFFCGGMSGQAVNTSHSRSGGLGFKSHLSGYFLRQGTLLQFVSLHPGVQMGTSNILLGEWREPCNELASRPGGGRNTPRHASC